jgi:hypothetical protein
VRDRFMGRPPDEKVGQGTRSGIGLRPADVDCIADSGR